MGCLCADDELTEGIWEELYQAHSKQDACVQTMTSQGASMVWSCQELCQAAQ